MCGNELQRVLSRDAQACSPQRYRREGPDGLLPHPQEHVAYRLFQVIRRMNTHPNPELLCSKSIYNFFLTSLRR